MPTQSADEISQIAPGTVIDGRYRVVRSIGQGGNGMVYEVEHARTGRKLALKALLDETGFARLEQEARAASVMKNGHTARIIDMEPSGPTGAYMVMELLEGQSLRGLLDDAGQLPLELTVNIAMQICECLQEAHELGIIHRDLKPENVFLCASPWPGQYDVKVLDFGVMKISEDGGAIPKSSLTRTGSTVGTPYYMSLEQLRNSSAVDVRADIYSLGVVMYECLSGRKPFQAETIGDLVYALCSGPPTQLARIRPDVPAEIGDLVMRTLSAKRDDRPSTMVELALALLSFATPAFALWVKVDGKQPALARAPVSAPPAAPRPAIPRLRTAVLEAKAAVPSPSSPSAAAIPPARPSAPIASAPATVGADPGPPRPRPPSPMAEDDGSSGRRDTPTEMFVKGVHAAPEQDDDAPRDRDTPTRALDMSSLPLREAIREAAGDAVGEAAGEAVGEGATPPVEGVPPPTSPAARVALPEDEAGDLPTFDGRRGQDGALVVPTYDPATAMAPSMLTAKLVIPPGGFPPMASDGIAAPSEALAAPRPPWQVTLDRALVSVGGAVDRLMKRFRAAPQNTQIILAIVAGTATIFLLGLILFVAVH